VHLGPGRYDWSFVDDTFHALRKAQITPIADLCHFGLPDWLGGFQNPDFPPHFAEYAGAFAQRYPWVELFTPVNEIRIACEFSALMGFWNEQEAGDRAYVTALKTTARANILAEEAILDVRPHAVFVQSEATGYFHAERPAALQRTHFLNQRRFISLDLCYGHEVSASMLVYLLDNGMTLDEYRWFLAHGQRLTSACVMGNDYYATNEHMVPPGDAPLYPAGPVYGYYMLTRQYFDRYKLPVMHTETNQLGAHDPVRWLRNQWLCLIKLKEDGVPLTGFTWYSLIDQVDWDSALRQDAGHVNPFGLYDLNRKIQPVGEAYRDLIRAWRDILPMQSRRLDTGPLIALDQPKEHPTTRNPLVR
jgi:beta-glucosidase/6-phospho-beta-glucosidase/beta-galactosidase